MVEMSWVSWNSVFVTSPTPNLKPKCFVRIDDISLLFMLTECCANVQVQHKDIIVWWPTFVNFSWSRAPALQLCESRSAGRFRQRPLPHLHCFFHLLRRSGGEFLFNVCFNFHQMTCFSCRLNILLPVTQRALEPPDVHHERLLPVSIAGLLVNLVGVFVFQHGGHGHSHGEEGTGSFCLFELMFALWLWPIEVSFLDLEDRNLLYLPLWLVRRCDWFSITAALGAVQLQSTGLC